MSTTETPDESSGRRFVLALVALLVFTGTSLGMHFVPLGEAGPLVALGIAGVKVGIVGMVFMELGRSLVATRVVALVTVAFVALLCLGIVGDVAFR